MKLVNAQEVTVNVEFEQFIVMARSQAVAPLPGLYPIRRVRQMRTLLMLTLLGSGSAYSGINKELVGVDILVAVANTIGLARTRGKVTFTRRNIPVVGPDHVYNVFGAVKAGI